MRLVYFILNMFLPLPPTINSVVTECHMASNSGCQDSDSNLHGFMMEDYWGVVFFKPVQRSMFFLKEAGGRT